MADAKGNITWVNDAFMTLTGYTQEDMRGQTLEDLLRTNMGDDTTPFNRHEGNGSFHGDISGRTKAMRMLLGSRTNRLCVGSRDSGRSVRLRVFLTLRGSHDHDQHQQCEAAATNRHCRSRVSNAVILNQSFAFSAMHDLSPSLLCLALPTETLLQYDEEKRLQGLATIRGRFGE